MSSNLFNSFCIFTDYVTTEIRCQEKQTVLKLKHHFIVDEWCIIHNDYVRWWQLIQYHDDYVWWWQFIQYHDDYARWWQFIQYHGDYVRWWQFIQYHDDYVRWWQFIQYHGDYVRWWQFIQYHSNATMLHSASSSSNVFSSRILYTCTLNWKTLFFARSFKAAVSVVQPFFAIISFETKI